MEENPLKETGQETPVSLSEKREYRRGMRRGILITVIVFAVALAAVWGIYAGTRGRNRNVLGQAVSGNASGDPVELTQVLNQESAEKLSVLLQALNTYYYEGMDSTKLEEGLYKGLVEGTGDKYTEYYDAEEYSALQRSTSGEYSGIGAVLTTDPDTQYPMISYVYKDSPAEKAGLKADDLIVKAGDLDVTSSTELDTVASTLRGEKGTDVSVTVNRDGEEITVTLTRDDVEMETVEYSMLNDGVGYIRLIQFSGNTEEQFKNAVSDLTEQGMTSMIIDLRDNGGGLVDSVAAILDDILPEGETVYMEDKNGNRQDYTSDDAHQIDLPMAVLVNGGSASASEIFTAAIKDYQYGTVIGTKTYGKGVYQSVLPLNDGSAVKITIGKFYSPKGNNFNEVGIEPDIELEYENTAGSDAEYSTDTDNQIQKAVEVLTGEQ